jgi:hypothetical protein
MLKESKGPRNQTSLSITWDAKNKLDFLLTHERPRPLKMAEVEFLIEERIKALGLTERLKKNLGDKKVGASC